MLTGGYGDPAKTALKTQESGGQVLHKPRCAQGRSRDGDQEQRVLDGLARRGREGAARVARLAHRGSGGEEAISAQQRSIIELAAKTHLLLESVDRFLFSMPSLVKQTTRQLFPIVLQRQQLADAQVRHMNTLGLRRLAKPMTSIHEYIAQHDAAKSVASKLEEPNPAEPQT